jgi:hypothetical protein
LLEEESTLHAFWSCPAAKDVWGSAKSGFQKCSFAGATFRALFEYCMEHFGRNELALLVVAAWCIWLRRNSFVFEGKFTHPNVIYNEAVISLEEFKSCNLKAPDSNHQASRDNRNEELSWNPLPAV